MCIDETWHQRHPGGVDRAAGIHRPDALRATDPRNPVILDRDASVGDDVSLRIHRHDCCVEDTDIGSTHCLSRRGWDMYLSSAYLWSTELVDNGFDREVRRVRGSKSFGYNPRHRSRFPS